MTDKEKIESLWDIVNALVDHISAGMNTSDQLEEFISMGMSEELLLALGYSQTDIEAKLAEAGIREED